MSKCELKCRVLCYTCGESFCRKHYDEHDHSLNNLLNILNDQIKTIDNRLENLNNEQIFEVYYEKLDQWRKESHDLIDQLYKNKCQEIQRRLQENINRQKEKINFVEKQIKDFLQEEEISKNEVFKLQSNIKQLENDINHLQQIHFQIDIQPLQIEKDFFRIQQINTNRFHFNKMTSPEKIIHCQNEICKPLASSEQYLLIHQTKHLCLINHECQMIKQIPWNYGRIWDMCWSMTLNRFILLGHFQVYLFDENSLLIEQILTIPRLNWWSCTCSNISLYLSTYNQSSQIYQFNLQSSLEFVQKCHFKKDDFIKDICYNNQTILSTIFNQKYLTKRIELRSITKFELIWSLELDIPGQCLNTLRSSTINQNQWLIADFHNQRLLQITNNGQIKQTFSYPISPWYINLFSPNLLVISTRNSIHFHKL